MAHIKVNISVSGFNEAEVQAGLAALLEEFQARPHLLTPQVAWDSSANLLLIEIETEGDTLAIQGGDVGAVLDEVSDCVMACIHFSSEGIAFHVDEAWIVGE